MIGIILRAICASLRKYVHCPMIHAVPQAGPDQLLFWLARVAEFARTSRQPEIPKARVAQLLEVAPSTITRFEQGLSWPRDPDATMTAYAYLVGRDPRELWEAAVSSLLAEGDRPDPETYLKIDEIPVAPQEKFAELFAARGQADGERLPASPPIRRRGRRVRAG